MTAPTTVAPASTEKPKRKPKKRTAKRAVKRTARKAAGRKAATNNKRKLTFTASKVVGLRGEKTLVLGQKVKSRMIRVDAAFADMLTKRAKDQGVSLTDITRKMVK